MKGLEALCYLDDIAHGRIMDFDAHELKLIVEKELKALEIIKNKEVWVCDIRMYKNVNKYNDVQRLFGYSKLTKEEYELLREVVIDEQVFTRNRKK